MQIQHPGSRIRWLWQLLWTLTVSVSIGLSNYFFPRFLSTHGDVYVLFVLGAIAVLALVAMLARCGARWCDRYRLFARPSKPAAASSRKRAAGGHGARVLPADAKGANGPTPER